MDAMRIVLTTQCQHHCFYCEQNRDSCETAPVELILQQCRAAVQQGISRFELTGGEPLLYEPLPQLIAALKGLPGVQWVSLTTNGLLLEPMLSQLRKAGLDGVNLHLDSVNALTLRTITGTGKQLNAVLGSIWRCAAQDIPLVITAVLHRQMEQDAAVLAGLARQLPVEIRFARLSSLPEQASLPAEAALALLQRQIPTLYADGPVYRAPGWKGCVRFGDGICGAFGLEQAEVLCPPLAQAEKEA